MAILIDSHPVRFNLKKQCGVFETAYVQPVQCGDITQFQMLVESCDSENNLLINSDFTAPAASPWNITGLWNYDSLSGRMTKLYGSTSFITQISPVADGVLLKVEVDVTVYSGGLGILVGSEVVNITGSGLHAFYVVANGVSGILVGGSIDQEFALSSVKMTAVNTEFAVRLLDSDSNVIATFTPDSDPNNFNFAGAFFTFTYDWRDSGGSCLPDGCYYFEVSDPCDCGNGGFAAEDFISVVGNWQYNGSSWLIVGGAATFNGYNSGDYAFVDQVVCDGDDYEVSYTLSNMAGSMFQVKLGVGSGALRTANGSYTEVITADGVDLTSVRLLGFNGGSPSSFTVTNFKIRRIPRSYNYRSNKFHLKDVHHCTLLISACNDDNGVEGGFSGTGFSPKLRLKADYGLGGYAEESSEYEFDDGLKRRYYIRQRKIRRLSFIAPDYIHDFMSTLRGYDHVYIDGVEVYFEGSEYPDPEYISNWNMGDVTINVSLKDKVIKNVRKSDEVATCEPDNQGVVILVDGGPSTSTAESIESGEILTTG